ncbi:MAG: amidohydrolase [Firmicutes bacterium]|nr:amidohydrolase [Bacillota bacterium]
MATIYLNGRIHTMGQKDSIAQGMLVDNGVIAALGSADEVRSLAPRGTREVDLGSHVVVPGLTDSHTHFMMFSLGLNNVILDVVPSLREALSRVEAGARKRPKGSWVLGGGFNKNLWEGARFPTRHDLDSVCPDHPVALRSSDYHTLWVNTLALRIAGITASTPVPDGGRIDAGPDGEPAGIIGENAMPLIEKHIPKPTEQEMDEAAIEGMKLSNRYGLTGVHVMEGADSLRTFQRLLGRGLLTLRVSMYVPVDNLDDVARLGIQSGFGGDMIRIAGIKTFTDGALNSQTADMLEPFEGTDSRGIATLSEEELDRIVGRAVQSGLAVAIHAIGDRANRKTLNALAKHQAASRAKGLRNRIEHAQLLHPDELPRFASTGTIASVQPLHATSDRYVADRLWGKRAKYAYPFKSLITNGARVTFGSDAPVETIDPMKGVYAAITRKREDEPASRPWYPEEILSIQETVRGYTNGPAFASYREGTEGSLEPGKVADFIVLSEDIFSGPPESVLRCRVLLNVVGGRVVYEA